MKYSIWYQRDTRNIAVRSGDAPASVIGTIDGKDAVPKSINGDKLKVEWSYTTSGSSVEPPIETTNQPFFASAKFQSVNIVADLKKPLTNSSTLPDSVVDITTNLQGDGWMMLWEGDVESEFSVGRLQIPKEKNTLSWLIDIILERVNILHKEGAEVNSDDVLFYVSKYIKQ